MIRLVKSIPNNFNFNDGNAQKSKCEYSMHMERLKRQIQGFITLARVSIYHGRQVKKVSRDGKQANSKK